MAKSIKQVIEEQMRNEPYRGAASESPIRTIKCPQCNWRAERRRKNGWGDTSYLNGQLKKHIEDAHPSDSK